MKKGYLLLAALLLLSITACSASNSEKSTRDYSGELSSAGDKGITNPEAPAASSAPASAYDSAVSYDADVYETGINTVSAGSERKLIRRASLSMETLSFEETMDRLKSLSTELEGYIESSSESGGSLYDGQKRMRGASISFRIPAKRFEEFLQRAGELGNTISLNISSDDITEQYIDTDAHIRSLELMEERLLVLLEKSVDLSDIIELERTLSNTRQQIESLTSTLRRWDGQVTYSTISINLQEVVEITEIVEPEPEPKTLGDRIAARFTATLKGTGAFLSGLLVVFIGALPVLVLLSVLVILFVLLIRFLNKKERKKRGVSQAGSSEKPRE